MILDSIRNIGSTSSFGPRRRAASSEIRRRGPDSPARRNVGFTGIIVIALITVLAVCAVAVIQVQPSGWSTQSAWRMEALTVPVGQPPAEHPAANQDELAASVRALDEQYPGRISVFAKNMDTGATFGVNSSERIQSASTIKLAVLVETFAQINEGRCRFDEELVVTSSNKAGGSGSLQAVAAGTRVPLRRAVELMISESDNTATNMLIDRLGGDNVNVRMDALGLSETKLLCKIEGGGKTAAYKEEKNKGFGIGVTTPYEMVRLLEMIDNGQAVRLSGLSADAVSNSSSTANYFPGSPDSPYFPRIQHLFDNSAFVADDMLSLLMLEKEHDWIRDEIGKPVASKTGSLDELRAEGAIADLEHGKIIMFIACHGSPMDWSDESEGHSLIKKVAGLIAERLDS